MYNCSLFIVTTNHKGEGQVSYKYNKHVRQLKSLHICRVEIYMFMYIYIYIYIYI